MSRHNQLISTGRSEPLTTGNVQCWAGIVNVQLWSIENLCLVDSDGLSLHTYIYTTKFIERQCRKERIGGAGAGWLAKADWKRYDLRWRLNEERLSIERTCAGREFQTDGEETEKEHEAKFVQHNAHDTHSEIWY